MALETALYVRFDVDNIMHVDLTLEKAWCNFPKGLSFSLNQFSSLTLSFSKFGKTCADLLR